MANYVSNVTIPTDGGSTASYNIRELFPHVGNCTVAASAAAKTVTIGNFKLYTGAWVVVKFSNTNSADVASLTLNVDGTGAKPIKYRNANLSSADLLIANRYTYFVYDGTNYQIVGDFDTDSDTYDRNRYRANIKAGTSALVTGNIIVGKDGVFSHLKSGGSFDISYPILYLNAAVAAGDTTNKSFDIINFTITTTQSISLTAYLPVFIKGKLSGKIFTPVSTAPLTQTVPTTDDGYQYMYLGNATSTSAVYLTERHPIYVFKNNAFGEIVHTATNVNGYTVGKSVPSDAVFTDTKVTSSANHYAPATVSGQDKSASASGATAAWSIDVVKGVTLNTDGKGHVTGVSVTSGKIPGNPNTDTLVSQTFATASNKRPLLMSYYKVGEAAGTAQVAYRNDSIYCNPSNGRIFATGLYTSGWDTSPASTSTSLQANGLVLRAIKTYGDGHTLDYNRYVVRTYSGKTGLNTSDWSSNGMLVTVEGGGLTIIGGGTSASALAGLISDDYLPASGTPNSLDVNGDTTTGTGYLHTSLSGSSENLILSADTDIYFVTNANTIANRKAARLTSDLYFAPLSTNTGSIGTSTYQWNTICGKTIYENGTSLANKYAAKATTLSGYGITDAKIANGVITLGSNTITPITSHQSVSNKAATLEWGTSKTIATIGSTNITVSLPANPNTDTKNTAGATDTSSKIFLIGATSQAANPQTYSDDQCYVKSGALQVNLLYSTTTICANTANSNTAGGISLYSSDPETYGIMFRGTTNSGKHGYVQSDWATYFTMNQGATTRGWIFRKKTDGPVASISGAGNAVFNGSVTVGGNSANTSGCRMEYNATTQTLDFVFV